jgi:hypothetical protein
MSMVPTNPKEFKVYIDRLKQEQRSKVGAVCDFCGTPPGRWLFMGRPAIDGPETDLPFLFEPEWAACEACKVLILNRDRDGLLERAVEMVDHSIMSRDVSPEQKADVSFRRSQIAHTHGIFYKTWRREIQPKLNEPKNLRPN